MPTNDELDAADQLHARAIAALEGRIAAHDDMLERHDAHLQKLDETVGNIRQILGGLATKGDILALSNKISDFNEKQLIQAQESIPGKWAAYGAMGLFLLSVLQFAVDHFK